MERGPENRYFIDAEKDSVLSMYVGELFIAAENRAIEISDELDPDSLELAVQLAGYFDKLSDLRAAAVLVELTEALTDEEYHRQATAYFLPAVSKRLLRSPSRRASGY